MTAKERMKIMVSNKLFHIDGWFNLPDTFHGTCGQALVLMGAYMQDQEKHYVEIKNEEPGTDLFGKLLEDRDNRVAVSYSFEKQDKEIDKYVGVE